MVSARNVFANVVADSGVCWLENVNITGSVQVGAGAALITTGQVMVSGSITAVGSTEVDVRGVLRVLGGFSAADVGRVHVGPSATMGIVSLSNVAAFKASGSMTSINAMGGGPIVLTGAKVLGGGIVRRGTVGGSAGGPAQDLTICGSTVMGGIMMSETTGNLNAVVTAACAPSELTGTVMVDKGTGNIKIVGNAMRAADVIIGEQNGNVLLADAVASDLSITRVSGSVQLIRVLADSDSALSMILGDIMMQGSTLGGDMLMTGNKNIRLAGNNLGNEMLTITANRGRVVVVNNNGFSGSISENQGVVFTGNTARGAFISKNSGPSEISNNKLGLGGLGCDGNVPPPTGGNNTYVALARPLGQCANL